jgi:vacuolar-type H+-ATPase subunit I/STV1
MRRERDQLRAQERDRLRAQERQRLADEHDRLRQERDRERKRLAEKKREARKRLASNKERGRVLQEAAMQRYENGGYDPAATEAAVQALIPHSPV